MSDAPAAKRARPAEPEPYVDVEERNAATINMVQETALQLVYPPGDARRDRSRDRSRLPGPQAASLSTRTLEVGAAGRQGMLVGMMDTGAGWRGGSRCKGVRGLWPGMGGAGTGSPHVAVADGCHVC
jgi:hypothetical protein